MEIRCPACQSVDDFPAQQVPVGKKWFALPCATCQALIKVDTPSHLNRVYSRKQEATRKRQSGEPASEVSSAQQQPKGEELKRRILKGQSGLRPMPQVITKVMEVMRNPNRSTSQLAEFLKKDQAIVAQILRVANSAYYSLSERVSSIQHVTVLLGDRLIAEIITMATAAGFLDRTLEGYGSKPGKMWRHSLAVAFGSKVIAKKKCPYWENDAFLAGLLHDAGKILLDSYVSQKKEMFEDFLKENQQTFPYAEKQILGIDHAEIGFEACGIWNVPPPIATAIRLHHHPPLLAVNKLAYIVHIADCLSIISGLGTGMDGMHYRMEEEAMEFLDPFGDKISDIMCEAVEAVQTVEEEMKKS